MYKSKRSLKVYEAPLGLNGKQQIPRIQLQGQWLEALRYHVGDKITGNRNCWLNFYDFPASQ